MEFLGIGLITRSVPILVKFYSSVFETKAEGNDSHSELRVGNINIAIFTVDGMESMAPNCMIGAGYGSFTVNFQVQDVDSEYERLKRLGVEMIMPPTTHPWGARSFWFRDPDGNIVNFVRVPGN